MMENKQNIIEKSGAKGRRLKEKFTSFPVVQQLLLIAAFIFVLFSGFIIPQSLALLSPDSNHQALVNPSNQPVSTSTYFTQKIESVDLKAEAAYVWDVVGQRTLFEKNPDQVLPLASITKLMTALVSYELVSDDTLVTISKEAAAQQSGGTLTEGEVFEAKKLADFALISSYNSAAFTLADSVGALLGEGDSVSQFVAAMNLKAEEMNLHTLEYLNPTGLDLSPTQAGAFGSARDTTFLMEYILTKYPQILTPTVNQFTVLYNRDGRKHEAENTNSVLVDIPNLLGSKTGYTDLAGGNLTIAFDAGYHRPIIVTVLGSTYSERFNDVKKLVAEVQNSIAK